MIPFLFGAKQQTNTIISFMIVIELFRNVNFCNFQDRSFDCIPFLLDLVDLNNFLKSNIELVPIEKTKCLIFMRILKIFLH